MLKKVYGQYKMDKFKIIKVNILVSFFKNGKINFIGGHLLLKEIKKLIQKRLILNHQIYQI